MASCAIILQYLYFIFSFLSLGALLAGGLGNVWWVSITSSKTFHGLWKDCFNNNTHTCIIRSDILMFKENPGTDPIIICLGMSFVLLVLSVILSFGISCCCKKKNSLMRSSMKLNTIFLLIAVTCAIDGMIYSEYQLRNLLKFNYRGWSFFAAWVGTVLQVFIFVLSLVQLYLKPKRNYSKIYEMSLVAAYSDSSEDEDENQFINKTDHISTAENAKKKLDNNGEVEQFDILDDEEWMQSHQNNPNSIFSNLPSSHKEASSFEETEEKDDEFLKIKPTLSDDVKHNLLDTFDKQENIKAFMNLPRPVKGGKKGTVKISLPSYTGGNDSEDEGGDVGEIGKVQESNLQLKKKSSLFTILPKPKNSVSVGANKNKVFQKQTNRSLIPHTLKKVPTSNKPKQNVMINTNDKVQDELSEDEEEILDNDSSNFFSLGKEDILTNNESDHFAITVSAENKSSLSKKVDMLPSSHSQPTLIIPLSSNPNGSITVSSMYPVTTNSTVSLKQNTFFSNLYSKDLNKSANLNACKDEKKIDCNKEFSLHPKTTYSDVTAPYGGAVSNNPNERMTNEVYEKCNANQLVEKESESFFAYGYQSAHEDPENISTAEPTDFYNQSNVDMPLDEDAIKALVGGKRKFRKEEINIIDVKGEDLQISKGEYLKNLTQESGYKPKVSKKDQPRKLEKRKHQITYLAYQAKEREHELRQAWSISRATRRDTQSKYGF